MEIEPENTIDPDIKPDRSVLYFGLAMFFVVLVLALISIYLEDIRKTINPPPQTVRVLEKEESKPLTETQIMDDVEVKASLTKFIEAFYVDQKKGYFDPPSYFAPITETYFNYHNLTYKGLRQVHDARQADFKNAELTWLVHTLKFERKDDSLVVSFWTKQSYFKPSKRAQESADIMVELIINKEGKIKSLREPAIKNLVSTIMSAGGAPETKSAGKPAPVTENKPKEPTEPPIYNSGLLDSPPEFKGGPKKLSKYLNKNVKYPQKAREQQVQGRVFVSFVVEADGSLSNFKLIRGIGQGCDEEAIRVLRNSPPWKPGLLDGKPVRTSYVLPVIFQLEE